MIYGASTREAREVWFNPLKAAGPPDSFLTVRFVPAVSNATSRSRDRPSWPCGRHLSARDSSPRNQAIGKRTVADCNNGKDCRCRCVLPRRVSIELPSLTARVIESGREVRWVPGRKVRGRSGSILARPWVPRLSFFSLVESTSRADVMSGNVARPSESVKR